MQFEITSKLVDVCLVDLKIIKKNTHFLIPKNKLYTKLFELYLLQTTKIHIRGNKKILRIVKRLKRRGKKLLYVNKLKN